ncbi:hypothetical protein BSU04_35830 [Caballeronia sordidicola]|uniref:Uncharacterized protein n=1 Tax=Caballeronia sordidicola TaxID=196367 RepID=A0A226WQV4_CABSO|nr:hypothetical protein BSU04_35830 [Caballeronia sordidicola]
MGVRPSEADNASSGRTCSVKCGLDLRASKSTERVAPKGVAELNDRFSISASETSRISASPDVR